MDILFIGIVIIAVLVLILFVVFYQNNNYKTIYTDFLNKITELQNTNNQIKEFARELNNFQELFTNPKQRGIIGEILLEQIITNVLPSNNYAIQHKFYDGKTVDAAIFIEDKIIPIDSKFSINNKEIDNDRLFIYEVKKRIDETSEYIKPNEKTVNFALMYIPSESLFYKIINISTNNISLMEYAYKRKVIIVSPSTLFAYLQIIFNVIKSFKVANNVEEILGEIQKLNDKIVKLKSNLDKNQKLINQISNNNFETIKILEDISKTLSLLESGRKNF